MGAYFSGRKVGFAVATGLALLSTCAFSEPIAGGGRSGSDIVFAKLPPALIDDFKANPQGLLVTFFSAGLPLSTRTRDLVLTDNAVLDSLITVARTGTIAQQTAIGAGLAGAAKLLVQTNPQFATALQQKVLQSGLLELIAAYSAISGDTSTASTGGGAGGGGGGGGTGQVGGVSSSGGNGGTNTGSNSGATSDSTPDAFTGNLAPGAAGFANPNNTGGTTSSSVTNYYITNPPNGSGFNTPPATGGLTTTTTSSVSPS